MAARIWLQQHPDGIWREAKPMGPQEMADAKDKEPDWVKELRRYCEEHTVPMDFDGCLP